MPNTQAKLYVIEQFADKDTEVEKQPLKEKVKPVEPKESVEKTPDDLAEEKEISPHEPSLFKIMFYMKQFRAHDIVIKLHKRLLVIDAVHKEHVDEHGFVTRSVVRTQHLPDDVVIEKLVSYFTADGVLIFQAPRKEAN